MNVRFTGNLELSEIHQMKTNRIDMHTHILPGFDDGAHDLEETLAIVKQMKEKGLEVIFWTPHINLKSFPYINYDSISMYYRKYSDILNQETGIKIFSGSELYCTPPLPQKLVPLGNSDFVLIEFPLDVYPSYLFDVIYNIQIRGYRVIMAHVERYRWLFPKKKKFLKTTIDYSIVEELKNKGVYFQVNYMTLSNIRQYRFMLPIIKEKKVEFLGSDKHWLTDGRSLIDFERLSTIEF